MSSSEILAAYQTILVNLADKQFCVFLIHSSLPLPNLVSNHQASCILVYVTVQPSVLEIATAIVVVVILDFSE